MFLGLDCGGSNTRAIAVDPNGHTVLQGASGPANWATTPRDEVRGHLAEAARGFEDVHAVCGCFAGLLTDENRTDAEAMLSSLFPDAKVCARPDYYAALAACPPETTVCVIAGTGSMVCSWYKGSVVKSGGGGPWFGDHGSAYGIVREALSEILKRSGEDRLQVTTLSNGNPSQFLSELFEKLNVSHLEGAISQIYQQGMKPATIAACAPSILRDFDGGAPYAEFSIGTEMDSLVDILRWHLKTYHPDVSEPIVALVGGVWAISPQLENNFLRSSWELITGGAPLKITHPTDSPALGAARLALQMI